VKLQFSRPEWKRGRDPCIANDSPEYYLHDDGREYDREESEQEVYDVQEEEEDAEEEEQTLD